MTPGPIRVLVVDDSALMRRMIADLLESSPVICVVGAARDGEEAVAKTETLRPDVITLDVEMPGVDGLTALARIMARRPTPVVMLSSRTRRGAQETVRSLALGAVDFVCKPSGPISMEIEGIRDTLCAKVRMAAGARVLPASVTPTGTPGGPAASLPPVSSADCVVAVASSTGGPRALEAILPRLPTDLPACLLIAQHMPEGFTAALAARLDALSPLAVREAADGDPIAAGCVLIAPGGRHMLVGPAGRVRITRDPPVRGARPAADPLMASAAAAYGTGCIGVVLTGMGRDGAEGARAVRRAGGATIAQEESTCVVYGMPRAALERGAVDAVLPLHLIAPRICELISRRRRPATTAPAGPSPRRAGGEKPDVRHPRG